MGYSNRSNTSKRRCRNLITISRCCCRCSKETGLLTSISSFLNTNGNRLFFRTIPLQSYSRIFSSPTQQSALFKHSGQRFNSLVVGSEHPHNGHSFLVVSRYFNSSSFINNVLLSSLLFPLPFDFLNLKKCSTDDSFDQEL